MGIETKYEYIYYTVINTNELSPLTREEWFNDGFTWEEAINYVQHLFKTSEDKSVNNYKVDYAGYEQDIDFWIRTHERHKERPVFVKFQEDQQILWIHKDQTVLIPNTKKIAIGNNVEFSILPFTNLKNLNISGAQWNLDNENIEFGKSLTLRNISIDNDIEVSVDDGKFCLIYNN